MMRGEAKSWFRGISPWLTDDREGNASDNLREVEERHMDS